MEHYLNFYTRRRWYQDSLKSILIQKKIYLLVDLYGNLGDHLIWVATKNMLDTFNIDFKTISIHEIDTANQLDSTLLIPGSGAFNELFHEWLPDLVLKASTRFQDVIILPSSFDASVPVVMECLSKQNVYAFAREIPSYIAIKDFGRAALYFDCALFFQAFDQTHRTTPATRSENLLLALREDQGSLLPQAGLKPHPEKNLDISIALNHFNDWLNRIVEASTVITDRLHVAISAVLLGKKLIYLDPYQKKISTYFHYVFREEFQDQIIPCSTTWLLDNEFIIYNKDI